MNPKKERVIAYIDGFNLYFGMCEAGFDNGKLVILLNGFTKKTQKTPQKEIDKAEKLMNDYLNSKK